MCEIKEQTEINIVQLLKQKKLRMKELTESLKISLMRRELSSLLLFVLSQQVIRANHPIRHHYSEWR